VPLRIYSLTHSLTHSLTVLHLLSFVIFLSLKYFYTLCVNCEVFVLKMSASIEKPSSSDASDYLSPIKIFGHAKAEIGDIFSEINSYIGENVTVLNGLFCCLFLLFTCITLENV